MPLHRHWRYASRIGTTTTARHERKGSMGNPSIEARAPVSAAG
jgi:hypothetical protein